MQRYIEKAVIFVITAVVLAWGIYHVGFYTKETVQTETVFSETVYRTLSGKGIAIRNEEIIPKSSAGAQRFLHDDGTRVGVGQPVIEYYTGDVKNRNIQNIRDYEQEIAMLEEAQNKNLNNFSTAPTISRDIREQLSNLALASARGKCDDLETIRSELTLLVNRRQIATGKAENYQERIGGLKSEVESLKSSSSMENIKQELAPMSGYFAKGKDGFENLNPEDMLNMTVDDFDRYINNTEPKNDFECGRIVKDSKWYFAVNMPQHEIEWVKRGQTATLSFNHLNHKVPVKVSALVIENNNPMATVVFISDYLSEEVVNVRQANVTVSFAQFTGLKINSYAIRFQKDENGQMMKDENGELIRGVYVLDNYVATFKTLDPTYEEASFVLSKISHDGTNKENQVELFDQVIVQGSDIYDGKIIQ